MIAMCAFFSQLNVLISFSCPACMDVWFVDVHIVCISD